MMIVIATLATYLELDGILDMALLPYFLAFASYCVADIIAVVIANGRNLFGHTHRRT